VECPDLSNEDAIQISRVYPNRKRGLMSICRMLPNYPASGNAKREYEKRPDPSVIITMKGENARRERPTNTKRMRRG
jgi:hypothetical protein